ncbi:hypothetical protein GQ42DRAFT_177339 [Ramicandelaber brevisporus]|nr:hypothetical protein GQ42DRAFT_177339 [Ramicandelaber brevisporus]
MIDSTDSGVMLPEILTKSFTIKSGEIVYGQLQTVCHGYHSEKHETSGKPTLTPDNHGTILQHDFNYKCAARNGVWNVRRVIVELKTCEDAILGYMMHHSDVDPDNILDQVTKIGWSTRFSNPNIVFVNRYDWNGYDSLEIPDTIPGLGKVGKSMDSEMRASRIIFFDKDNMFEEGCGVHIPAGDAGYANGYLVFSGQKHSDFKESDELIAFVYDKDLVIDRYKEEEPVVGGAPRKRLVSNPLPNQFEPYVFKTMEIDGTETSQLFYGF